MNGYEYEQKCAILLKNKGFSNITITPGSGDQGIDIIAYKAEAKYGVQCKYYTGTVGNKAVQEAYAGAAYYGCSEAMVITNSTLSKQAFKLAKELNVEVWEHIDAIYLQENSQKASINYSKLTQEELENLQINKIEAYLQEKYQAFHAKYPADKNKDEVIAEYIDRMKRQADNCKSCFLKRANTVYGNIKCRSFKNFRDPTLTPFKNELREYIKEFSRQLKIILDDVNQEAEHYMSVGISLDSIIALANTINYIFNIGDGVAITFNELTIAKFNWSEKYIRIKHKWAKIKIEVPSDPEKADNRKEQLKKEKLQRELNSAKENLKKTQKDIWTELSYIKNIPDTLERKKAELNDMNFTERSAELQADYYQKEADLTIKLNTAKERLEKLLTDEREETDILNKLFVLSIKKKNASKKHLNELAKDIENAKQICEHIETELSLAKNTYESDIRELTDKLADLQEQINIIEQQISKSKAIIKSKEPEIACLKITINTLEEQLKDFHKKYLLKNYQHIVRNL